MKKILSIQASRGVAAAMVLAFHAMSVDRKYFGNSSVLPSWLVYGQTGLDLFFVISGLVMMLTSRGMTGIADALQFLRNRALRIYPTYWAYFLVLLVVYLTVPTAINASQDSKVGIWTSFFLLPSDTLPLLMVAWSLTLELWFYGVVGMVIGLSIRRGIPLIFGWGILVIGVACLIGTPTNAYFRVLAHPFALEFMAGALVGIFLIRSEMGKNCACGGFYFILTGASLLLSGAASGVLDGSDVITSVALMRVVLFGGGYAALLAGLIMLERAAVYKPFAWLADSGNMSYSLYLSHILTLSAAGRIWLWLQQAHLMSSQWVIGYWIATFGICLAAGWLAYQWIERPLTRLARSRRSSRPAGLRKTA